MPKVEDCNAGPVFLFEFEELRQKEKETWPERYLQSSPGWLLLL